MIVVTGATGNVGRPLIQSLAAAGEQVTAVSRRISDVPNGVPNDVPNGVRRLQADLAQPKTLEPALDGAKAVFLLTAAEFLANGNMKDVMEVVEASVSSASSCCLRKASAPSGTRRTSRTRSRSPASAGRCCALATSPATRSSGPSRSAPSG